MTEEAHDESAAGTDAPAVEEVDKVIEMKGSVHVGPFQAEILEGKISQAPTHDMHVMVAPIRRAEVKSRRACQLPPGLQVLHVYIMLNAGSKQVLIVVQNMTDSAIFLKKGMCMAHVVSVMLVPPEEAPLEQAEDAQALKEQMTVQERQEKLLEKLNLDGLSEWSPCNAAIVRELLLSYHDTFALSPMSLGAPAPLSMRFDSMMISHSRSVSDAYLHLY